MSGRNGGLSRAEAWRGINEAVAVVQPRPSGREDGSHPPETGTQNLDSVKAVGTDSPNLSRHVHPELCLSLGLYASISILTKKKKTESYYHLFQHFTFHQRVLLTGTASKS